MPMALNYKPRYLFPFEPNKHYVLLQSPDDIAKLSFVDPGPYVKASIDLWNNYFKPYAAAKYLMQLIS